MKRFNLVDGKMIEDTFGEYVKHADAIKPDAEYNGAELYYSDAGECYDCYFQYCKTCPSSIEPCYNSLVYLDQPTVRLEEDRDGPFDKTKFKRNN